MKLLKNILIVTCCLSAIACSKVTDQVPESSITPLNFYKTASDADNAINSCYDALQGSPVNFEIWGDGRADMLASTDRSSSLDLQVTSGNVSASNDYVSWSALYSGINRCNSVLKNVPNITDAALAARQDRILGEAYFLRGLFYFYLARTYENAPMILEPYENLSGNFFPEKSDRATLFAQVEKDLKLAEAMVPDLPFSTAIENKGKANKAAIRATLADLYLWQKKYQEAADAALLVISSPAGYALLPGDNFANIFTGKNTAESIFEVQYNYSYQEGINNAITDIFLPLGAVLLQVTCVINRRKPCLMHYLRTIKEQPSLTKIQALRRHRTVMPINCMWLNTLVPLCPIFCIRMPTAWCIVWRK